MNAVRKKRDYLLIIVVAVLFVFMSYLSLTSIGQLRGNARVVNYVGIVRGATQRLIKKELQGYPDDALIKRLDSIIDELITGIGTNELIVLPDRDYLDHMNQIKTSWTSIKTEIESVRKGKDSVGLFEMSEAYFNLADRTVSSAELYSEKQVDRSTKWLFGINSAFAVVIVLGGMSYCRAAVLRKRTETLDKIAYLDPLTQMPNRASCEREIDKYTKSPPEHDLAVFMFDMNNLKRVNDELGHSGGDRVIADFARIIKNQAAEFGFVGRYGGDEFIAIFPDADETRAQSYLTKVNEKIVAYNLLHVRDIEKLSFAVGYVIQNAGDHMVESMINEADRLMYARKRQMKENHEA